MNIYSKLLKQLNMCGHAVLVTDYPTSDTSDGTAASAVCHQTSRKTILSAVPGQMKPDNGTILPVSGSSASCSSVCGTLPPINTTLAQTALSEGSPVLDRDHGHIRLLEPFSRKERLLILGGDHVGLALAEFAAKTGFSVYVADDRPCFANQLRFPWAEEVYCMDFPAAIQAFQPDTQDYIAVLTRGHRHDADCLTALSHCPVPTYLGMIGSRRRVKELKTHLEETEHLSHEWLESIHTPIGLAIKAVTPEEIAISILAELILTKRTLRPDHIAPSDADLDVIAALADPPANRTDLKKALVTIVETKGPTPRKAGANMIVYEDGTVFGTIGGGCAEAGLVQTAREVMRSGSYQFCKVDMTGEVAAEEGVVCGGWMMMALRPQLAGSEMRDFTEIIHPQTRWIAHSVY